MKVQKSSKQLALVRVDINHPRIKAIGRPGKKTILLNILPLNINYEIIEI
jgi:hypothetical protein